MVALWNSSIKNQITKKSLQIEIIFVCTIRGLRYQKQNRMEEETEPQT